MRIDSHRHLRRYDTLEYSWTNEGMSVLHRDDLPAELAVSLSWTLRTLRTMQMTRLTMISALLILGLAATGAAMMATQEREPAQTRPAAPSKTAA